MASALPISSLSSDKSIFPGYSFEIAAATSRPRRVESSRLAVDDDEPHTLHRAHARRIHAHAGDFAAIQIRRQLAAANEIGPDLLEGGIRSAPHRVSLGRFQQAQAGVQRGGVQAAHVGRGVDPRRGPCRRTSRRGSSPASAITVSAAPILFSALNRRASSPMVMPWRTGRPGK